MANRAFPFRPARAAALIALLAIGHFALAAPGSKPGGPPPGLVKNLQLSVLSSAPDQVTGGDARIAIDSPPGLRKQIELMLNGQPVDLGGFTADSQRLEGVIDGLAEGANELVLVHQRFGELHRLTLVNHPITGPVFSGPHQQPFVCTTAAQLGIQPNIDRLEPPGFRVYDEAGAVIGYSTNCSIDPFVTYLYRTTGNAWSEWPQDGEAPADLATTTTIDGRTVDFVVRLERGTINRFIYSYAMLVDPAAIAGEGSGAFDTSRWNGRLLYQFQGGVGIGHTQGGWSMSNAVNPAVLGLGHAIAYSTGNRTGEHYNLQLGGETALMTKERFIERYGEPLYTVGLGGSGGGIQQYVYGQNHPGLLDAAIPQRSYPDMVTQTIHISDCELLEHYMDVTDGDNARWQHTANRSWLVGLNATDFLGNPLYPLQIALGYSAAPGMTECVPAWRGLSPLALNPHFGAVDESRHWEPQSDIAAIEWTHMDDVRNVYGVGDDGFANRTTDNVGVQYGLAAFTRGDITTDEFLDLNAYVGGWKPSSEMVQEAFPFLPGLDVQDVLAEPSLYDPWSRRNMMLSGGTAPAPRHEGNLDSIAALYESGLVFRGAIDIPILDIRDWLEPLLDMHNSHQSFAARQRILNERGDAGHHVIWFADIGPEPHPGLQFDLTGQAVQVMDEWMLAILRDPKQRVVKNRPAAARDTCFTHEGEVIARGDAVWAGILDERAPGACTARFPIYSTSRIEAGGPITGDVFKCQRKPVAVALTDGTYGHRTFTAAEAQRLEAIFPDGVCDYSLPDAGRPETL